MIVDTLADAKAAATALAHDLGYELDDTVAASDGGWIVLGLLPRLATDAVMVIDRATGEARVVSRWTHLDRIEAMQPLE